MIAYFCTEADMATIDVQVEEFGNNSDAFMVAKTESHGVRLQWSM